MKRTASLIIAALLVVAASLGYSYYGESTKVGSAKAGLVEVSNSALFCLSDMNALGTMVNHSVSADTLRERLGRYSYCAEVLARASSSLYDLTGERKYLLLSSAMENLAVYFHSAMNSQNPSKGIEENLEVILKVGNILNDVWKAGGVSKLEESRAEKLFNLTERLS